MLWFQMTYIERLKEKTNGINNEIEEELPDEIEIEYGNIGKLQRCRNFKIIKKFFK